jgi:hypothetical protein
LILLVQCDKKLYGKLAPFGEEAWCMSDERSRRSVPNNFDERCEKLLIQRLTKLICCGISVEGISLLPTAVILLPAGFSPQVSMGSSRSGNLLLTDWQNSPD